MRFGIPVAGAALVRQQERSFHPGISPDGLVRPDSSADLRAGSQELMQAILAGSPLLEGKAAIANCGGMDLAAFIR
ncbi:hypothetical protein V475_19855 [Sphingobium baderi LL03]|uniref:Uncharacterized protein n=2 Tax=Sphingobium TaxID=165695 RepID=T0I647_9SPHN|nr:hypothetical protein K426_26430 [Sphingobium sp. TKS]EQB05119.1 hypothetical protein L485_03105 [Sphingobium baderi LL03]KKW89531.1 hypothetical protein YP76_25140 [Sphingobium chungbukense]KMS60071.1 hypothetical protein V475_19855 [Sphingobium baderi LL03]